jgi:SAM-dependent methyltransferase
MVAASAFITRGLHAATVMTSLAYGRLPGGDFVCPVCDFRGHFSPIFTAIGIRRDALCPRCKASERLRFQVSTLPSLLPKLEGGAKRVLHLAPEPTLSQRLKAWSSSYTTADIDPRGVDLKLDLRSAPQVANESFDLIWASHVFEHIDEDFAAMREVYRMLAPGGCAVLPVPLIADATVEYSKPSPYEAFHVRAPGLDYFDRYRVVFDEVDITTSRDSQPAWQTWILERRSGFPNRRAPERPAQDGLRHVDAVPFCWRCAEQLD